MQRRAPLFRIKTKSLLLDGKGLHAFSSQASLLLIDAELVKSLEFQPRMSLSITKMPLTSGSK